MKWTLLLLAALTSAAAAQVDSSTTTTSEGKSYSFCRHTLATEKLLTVRVAYMGTTGELRSGSLKNVYSLAPKTYTLTFRALTEPDQITGIRIGCTFQQPNPNLAPNESRDTQPWVETQWIPVVTGQVLKMNILVNEPAPGLRSATIGGFR